MTAPKHTPRRKLSETQSLQDESLRGINNSLSRFMTAFSESQDDSTTAIAAEQHPTETTPGVDTDAEPSTSSTTLLDNPIFHLSSRSDSLFQSIEGEVAEEVPIPIPTTAQVVPDPAQLSADPTWTASQSATFFKLGPASPSVLELRLLDEMRTLQQWLEQHLSI